MTKNALGAVFVFRNCVKIAIFGAEFFTHFLQTYDNKHHAGSAEAPPETGRVV